jgi:plasmid stabilization system protein ParE
MFKVIIDPLAEKDIDEIYSWYESKRAYLGFEFLNELE